MRCFDPLRKLTEPAAVTCTAECQALAWPACSSLNSYLVSDATKVGVASARQDRQRRLSAVSKNAKQQTVPASVRHVELPGSVVGVSRPTSDYVHWSSLASFRTSVVERLLPLAPLRAASTGHRLPPFAHLSRYRLLLLAPLRAASTGHRLPPFAHRSWQTGLLPLGPLWVRPLVIGLKPPLALGSGRGPEESATTVPAGALLFPPTSFAQLQLG